MGGCLPGLWLLCLCIVNVKCLQILDDGRYECVREGRFPYPGNCGLYIDCLPEGGESHVLVARVGSCDVGTFSPDQRKCLNTFQGTKSGQWRRKSRALESDPRYNHLCSRERDGFFCSDCKTMVKCFDGVAYPEPCQDGDLCDVRMDDFGGGVCYPGRPINCTCASPTGLVADLYDDRKFLFCESAAADPLVYQCPDMQVFIAEASQCMHAGGMSGCTEKGFFANPDNCNEYYSCILTTSGWLQKLYTCDANPSAELVYYNEATHQCEDPCLWPTGDFICEEEGRFADPLDCNRYYECVAEPHGFRKTRQECPEGFSWSAVAWENFGNCVETDANTVCNSISLSKCHIPEGTCPTIANDTDWPENMCREGQDNCQCSMRRRFLICTCEQGYTLDGSTCADVDECSAATSSCDANAICTNNVGSFTCTCQDGFNGDGTTCTDVDECSEVTAACDTNAICTNTVGGFTCTCQDGFNFDGITCSDVDECSAVTSPCDANAICTNNVGSFTCTCQDGFNGDGTTCTDVDECSDVTAACDTNAICTNNVGSFTCTCQDGFNFDGTTCSDVDECSAVTSPCDANAICTNNVGSFTCTCQDGFNGDGITCSGKCDTGDISHEDSCFSVPSLNLTYTEATAICLIRSGVLAKTPNAATVELIATSPNLGNSELFWVGASRSDDGTWRWLDGTSVDLEIIRSPNSQRGSCLALNISPNPMLSPADCETKMMSLCETEQST